MTSHDQLFKSLFRAFFSDLLALAGRPELDAELIWEQLAFLDKEVFLDLPEGARREADLLAAVPDRARGETLLIHLEIERRFRSNLGRRLWRLALALDQRHAGPVLSVAVFLRGGPAGGTWPVHVERAIGRDIVRFTYLSDGVSRLPAESLLARSEPLAWALAALARPGALGRARLKKELLKRIATAPLGEFERFLLLNTVETYLQLTGHDAEEFERLRRADRTPEGTAMATLNLTWAEQMELRGLERGLDRLRRTVLRLLS